MLRLIASDRKISGSILVIFNNDRQMSGLNYRFKRKKQPTDVLAFNLAERPEKNYIEGEIYVNLQAALRQAGDFKVDYFQEVARLCAHGFLHLSGYDDSGTPKKNEMWKIQERYLLNF
jgi:probable rRNA maturation factor